MVTLHPAEKLFIFDIDGTLTYSGGLARVAFERAINEIYGIPGATAGINPAGRTDRDIFREVLVRQSLPIQPFDDLFDNFTYCYLPHLYEVLFNSDKPRLNPGIIELLDMLDELPNVHLAIGTGNIEPGARTKLKRVGIDHFFPVGGYCTDSESRPSIIRAAYDRSRRYFGIDFDLEHTFVIGDTPLDIHAGKQLGALTIGVATGGIPLDVLKGHNPHAAFESLADKQLFRTVVGL